MFFSLVKNLPILRVRFVYFCQVWAVAKWIGVFPHIFAQNICIYQNLVFVSCTHRDLYLINQSQAFMHRLSIKVAKSSCCTGHKERTERKSSLSGDQGGAVQLRLAATHISRSQCHNIAAATLVHRTLTFERPAPSCLWDLRADDQVPLVPSSTPSCSWSWILLSAQDKQVTTLSPSQLAARQQQRGQFEAAAATWGKAIIQRSAIIRRRERQKREKIDVLSSLQQ